VAAGAVDGHNAIFVNKLVMKGVTQIYILHTRKIPALEFKWGTTGNKEEPIVESWPFARAAVPD
jgi:hypothetical protein